MLVFVYENEYYDKWGGVLGAGWNFVGGGRLCLQLPATAIFLSLRNKDLVIVNNGISAHASRKQDEVISASFFTRMPTILPV